MQTAHWDCDDGPGQRCPEIMASAWLGEAAVSRTRSAHRCGGCLAHVGTRKHRLKASSLLIGDCSRSVVHVCTEAEPSEKNHCNLQEPLS